MSGLGQQRTIAPDFPSDHSSGVHEVKWPLTWSPDAWSVSPYFQAAPRKSRTSAKYSSPTAGLPHQIRRSPSGSNIPASDRENVAHLGADPDHAGLERTKNWKLTGIGRHLLIGVADEPHKKLFERYCDAPQSRWKSIPLVYCVSEF